MPGSAGIRGPRRRVEEGTATAVARRCASCVTVRGERFPHIVAGHSSFYIAALLLTCAIRTTLGAYRQVSPGSAWTRLRSHGRVGGALHLQRRRRRDSGELHEHAASAEEYWPNGGSVRGGQVCPRHRGGILAARPSGKRRGREAAKARRVRSRRGGAVTSTVWKGSIPLHDRID